MRCLHLVFNVVKLTPAPDDPIIGRHWNPLPSLELINREEEYIVEKVLNSRMFQQKLQYLVKWEGYGVEGNTWEYSENLNNAQEQVVEFYTRNSGALYCIHTLAFSSIPFQPISLASISGQCFYGGGGVIVRGTPLLQTVSAPLLATHHLPPSSAFAPVLTSASTI